MGDLLTGLKRFRNCIRWKEFFMQNNKEKYKEEENENNLKENRKKNNDEEEEIIDKVNSQRDIEDLDDVENQGLKTGLKNYLKPMHHLDPMN